MPIRTLTWEAAPTPRRILYIVGVVLVAGGLATIPSIVVSWMYQEGTTALHLGATALAMGVTGGLIVLGAGRPERLRPKDSFAGVALAWLAVIIFGSLPYLLSGSLGFTDSMFESTAGFTTTGATTIEDLSEVARPADPPLGLLEALGCPPDSPTLCGTKLWMVRLDTEKEIKKLRPDMAALRKVKLGDTALGVSVTAPGTAGNDFASRFFGPWVGVDEDPVTGMAHTVLGPYWLDELDAIALRARQVSTRGGNLRVRREGNRIQVSGQAVTVVKGTLSF